MMVKAGERIEQGEPVVIKRKWLFFKRAYKAEREDCSTCKYDGNQARIDGDCDGCNLNHIPMYSFGSKTSNWTPKKVLP